MGGQPWFYFVEYQSDIGSALQRLRQREFQAGRYNPVVRFPEFPVTAASASPGAKHRSIDEALQASDADGTRSILDMEGMSEEMGPGVVVAFPAEELLELFGTERPSRAMIEENMDFFNEIDRGHGIYFIAYENDRPAEIFFAGYSYD
jgi:hypothetical protein